MTRLVDPEERKAAVRRVLQNGTSLLLAYVLPRLCTFLSVVVAARLLGAGTFGAYGTAAGFATLLSVLSTLGMLQLLVRDIAQRPEAAARLLRAAHVVKTVSGAAMVALLVLLARVLDYPPEVTNAAMVLALGYWIGSYVENFAAYFQGTERMQVWAEASGLFGLVAGVLGVAAIALTRSIVWFSAALLVAQLAALAWLLVRAPADVRWGARPGPGEVASLARATLPFAVAFTLLTVHYRIDVLLIAGLRTAEEVGFYAAAYKFVDVFHALVLVAVGAMYPRLARIAQGRGSGRWAATRASELVLLVAVPTGFALWVLSETLVLLVFGASYAAAVPVLATLALVFPAFAVNLLGGYVLGAERRMGLFALLYAGGLSFKVALAFWAIPRWGAPGAAAAVLAGESALAAASVIVLGRVARAAPGIRAALLAGCAAGLGWALGASPVEAALGAPAAASVYLALVLLLYALGGAVSVEERRTLRGALVSRRRGPAAPVGSLP